MKQQLNVRASALTVNQLDWLAQHWGASLTETMTLLVDRVYQQEKKDMIIELRENNAGRIFIGNAAAGYWDATGAADDSFADDATAIADSDTADWTIEHYDLNGDDLGEVVATWQDGRTALMLNQHSRQPLAGIAANRYAGIAA